MRIPAPDYEPGTVYRYDSTQGRTVTISVKEDLFTRSTVVKGLEELSKQVAGMVAGHGSTLSVVAAFLGDVAVAWQRERQPSNPKQEEGHMPTRFVKVDVEPGREWAPDWLSQRRLLEKEREDINERIREVDQAHTVVITRDDQTKAVTLSEDESGVEVSVREPGFSGKSVKIPHWAMVEVFKFAEGTANRLTSVPAELVLASRDSDG